MSKFTSFAGGFAAPVSTSTYYAINPFIVATGGTISYSGVYKIHTFTTVGVATFQVNVAPTLAQLEYLVVAGGGGGGGQGDGQSHSYGGGGGAGGMLTGTMAITKGAHQITVGAGGTFGTGIPGFGTVVLPTNGGNSKITPPINAEILALGGGRGGGGGPATVGGSGGGGGRYNNTTAAEGTPGQGTAGSVYTGGGAGGPGTGLASSISGTSITYAKGGPGSNGAPIAPNTGNGGGGYEDVVYNTASAGGSGIVIVRYRIAN